MPKPGYLSDEDEDGEREYAPRSWDIQQQTAVATKRKLPTKSATGVVSKKPMEKRAKVIAKESEQEERQVIEEDEDEQEEAPQTLVKSAKSEKKKKQEEPEIEMDHDTAMLLIAELSNSMLANEPNSLRAAGVKTLSDGSVVPPSPTSMDRLLSLCRNAKNWAVKKAAFLSLLAVFRDVLPTEKIRELTELERKAKMTKETRIQISMDKSVLGAYKLFLAMLFEGTRNAPWERRKRDTSDVVRLRFAKVARLSIYCLCNMMEARPNFNFYDDILKTVIPRTSSPDAKTAIICVEGLERAIHDDASFECAANVIRSLGKLYERKKVVSAQAVAAISTLRLNIDLKDEKRMDLITKAKKEQQKRRRKLGIDLTKVLEETEVTMTRNHEIMQRQVEIIRELFTLYLRILTDASEKEIFLKRALTTEALKGASRLVSLVNIEFAHGLVRILTSFFRNSDTKLSNLTVALQTCETGLSAMAMLSRPELRTKSTASEEVYFTKLLLRCVANLSEDETAVVHMNGVMRCVNTLFMNRREADAKVVADFCVRLVNAAMRVPTHFGLGLLALERKLVEKYPAAKDILLGAKSQIIVEEEACGPLIPVAYAEDTVGSESRCAWELHLLAKSHYHVAMRKYANDMTLGKPNVNDRPIELISSHHPVDGEVFYPFIGPGQRARPKPVLSEHQEEPHYGNARGKPKQQQQQQQRGNRGNAQQPQQRGNRRDDQQEQEQQQRGNRRGNAQQPQQRGNRRDDQQEQQRGIRRGNAQQPQQRGNRRYGGDDQQEQQQRGNKRSAPARSQFEDYTQRPKGRQQQRHGGNKQRNGPKSFQKGGKPQGNRKRPMGNNPVSNNKRFKKH